MLLAHIETTGEDYIALDGCRGDFHLPIQGWVADDPGTVSNLTAQLVEACDSSNNRAFLDQRELTDFSEWDTQSLYFQQVMFHKEGKMLLEGPNLLISFPKKILLVPIHIPRVQDQT